jgi:hypothetical protein
VTRILLGVFSSVLVLLGVAAAAAQDARPSLETRAPNLSSAEIQRLFDAYVVVQAQEMLKLSDSQYAQFVTRLKTLQEARRRSQTARNEVLQDLRRLAVQSEGSEELVNERLRALAEQETHAAAELNKAYAAIDQVLDVRQRARFRIFEEQMERRKFELLMRARQGRPNLRRNQ